MGIGDILKGTLDLVFENVFGRLAHWTAEPFVKWFNEEVSLHSIDLSMFESESVKKSVSILKEECSTSPVTASDLANVIMNTVRGESARQQFTAITDLQLADLPDIMQKTFEFMRVNSELSLLGSVMGIIGSLVPTLRIGEVGNELRRFLDYSGTTSTAAFLHGELLKNTLAIKLEQKAKNLMKLELIPIPTAIILYFRGKMPLEELHIIGNKQGFTSGQIDLMIEREVFYPSAQDFISFGVREVFNEAVVNKYGYDRDFPKDILPHAKKCGIREDQLKWYWRAHWILPSPRQGYEMLRRGEIDREELSELLRISDMAPGWIEKMINIAYKPIGRIDLRRLYRERLIDNEGFAKGMQALGYSPENAELMRRWTEIDIMGKERDLTFSMILTGVKLGKITREKAIKELIGLRYDEEESKTILDLEIAKQQNKDIREDLAVVRYRYAKGLITTGDMREIIQAMSLPEKRITREIYKAVRQREKKAKLPSKSDLVRWAKAGMLNKNDFQFKMNTLGYTDEDIEMYIRETFD